MASTYTLRIFHYFVLLIVVAVEYASTTDETDFVGCYEVPINPDPDDQPINPGLYQTNDVTVMECMGLCRDYFSTYTLLINAGEICLCAGDLKNDVQVSESVCDAMCPESCGSKDHFSAYSTPSKLGNINIYRGSFGLKQLSYDEHVPVPTLANVTFSMNFTGTENIMLSLDFGDNYPIDKVQFGTPSNIVHLFIQPSMYLISGVAEDVVLEETVEIQTIVNAMTLISNVSIVCPEVVGANDLFECTVSVMVGTSMSLQADYEVGNISLDLIDASHTIYGISTWITSDTATEPGYRYFFGQVMFEGVLVSLEFDVASNGSFTLEVYRPSVVNTKKNCTIKGSYNFRTRRCPGEDQWPDNVSVELIKSFTCVAESFGMHYRILHEDEYLYVSKGDMLAVSSTDGRLKRSSDTTHQEYISETPSQLQLDGFNTLIQVTIVTPSRAKLQMKLPDPISAMGDDVNRTVLVEVENALSFTNVSTSVHVQSFVNGVEIIADSYGTTNETIVLTIPKHNGTEFTYEWNLGNGDTILGAEYDTVEYSWTFAGVYNVKVKGFNDISEDIANFIIIIEDPVYDNITLVPASPQPRTPDRDVDVTNVTESAMVRWKVLEGSNFYVDVSLGTTEKGYLSASPRGFTMEDNMTVDGLILENVVLMNEGACLTPLKLEADINLSPFLAAVSGLSVTIDLKKLCTVLGVVASAYGERVAEAFQVSYSNDNHHFINDATNRDDFRGANYTYNATSIFKNSFIARYVKITIVDCDSNCGMAFQVLGCEWSPVCLDHLELSDRSTQTACSNSACDADLGSIRTVTGILIWTDSTTVPSFTIRHSVDGESYRDLIDRSGVVVTFSSSISDGSPVTHYFPEGVIMQYVKVLPENGNVPFSFELLGCKGSRVCNSGFGVQSVSITDDTITLSPSLEYMPLSEDGDYWVSVDLGKPETITGVLTRGCPGSTAGTFTAEYCGNDDVWMTVSDRNENPSKMVFNLNSEALTMELSRLPYPIIAQNFKMNVDSCSCFHFEPVGCYTPLICRTSLIDVSKYRTSNGVLNTDGPCFDVDGVDWFEFDVGIQRSISGIITKNLLDFQVQYSQEKYNWVTLLDDDGTSKSFTVTNQDIKTANMFYTADAFVDTLYARYVRILSSNWPDGEFCLELIGCEGDGLLLFTSDTDANIAIEFTVYNEISRVNFSTEAFIQTPIADFQVHQTPILNFDRGYGVKLTSAHGSDLHLNATFNGTDLEQSDLQFDDSINYGICELRNEIYPTYGNFVVSVTAENEVSGPRTDDIVVHIQVVILGLVMEPTTNYLSTNETMLLDYTTNGTEILMQFEYGDQTSVEIYHDVLFGNPQRINHTYIRPDVYLFNLYAQNNISNETVYYSVVVENPVVAGEIQLTPNSPGRIDSVGTGNGTLDVQYDFLGDVHDFPTNATAMYNITGMETKQQNYSLVFNVNTKRTYHPLYLHTYGVYFIDIFISNHISHINYSIEIEMEQPVENLAIFTSHKYQRVNWNVTFLVNITWGSRVTFVVDFGDSSTYTTSNQSWFEVSHSYNDSGVYPVTVSASNLISNVSARMATDQFIQYPVDGVKLHSREINLLPFKGIVSGVVSVPFFVFQNETIHLPTNVTFIAYFNTSVDDPKSNNIALAEDDCVLPSSVFQLDGFNLTQCFNQDYTVEGDYHVCIVMWNEVSNGTACRDFTILEQITQVSTHVYYIDVNEDGTESEEPAYEFEGKIYVPLDRKVVVKISYFNGTGITYYWDFNDTYKDSIIVTDIPEASYEYTYPGIYEVMINSSNPVFFNVTSVKIRMQGAMRNMTITGPGPKDITKNVKFTLTASIFGTGVCYRFEYFDVEHRNSTIVFTGDQTMCRTRYNNITEKNDVDYDDLWMKGFNGDYAELSQVQRFNTTCIHNVSITAFNIVSDQFRFIQQIITTKPCFFPVLSVKNLNLCNKNYNCDDNGYRKFKSADVIIVFGEVTISCQSTNVAFYNWTLSNDHGPYSLPDNVITSNSPLPVLSIPRASFGTNYDTYGISLTVTMDIECGLVTTDSTRITVESSDLQARISGGSYRTFGNSSTLEIDASEETIDPDSQSVNNLNVSWLCRQKKFTYNGTTFNRIETFADIYDVTSSGAVDSEFESLEKDKGWAITRGCFYDGSNKAGGHLTGTEFSGLKINVEVNDFQPGFDMEYQFQLVIMQGNRVAYAQQTIYVQQNDPPDVKLQCVLNCQERTNPSGRFSLQSLLNSSNPEAYSFRWYIYKVNYTSDEEEEVNYNDWQSYSGTSRSSGNLVINKNFFEPGVNYNLALNVEWEVESKPASAQTRWEVSANDFPQVGFCDVEPLDGFAVNTTFMIMCNNFTDDDKPLRYEFSVKSRNSSIWTTIYSGLENKLPNRTPLPQGDPPDYELIIRIRAYDKYRACSEALNMTINVGPWSDSEETLNELVDKEVDDIRELVGGGNIVSAANKATSLTKFLNTMSQNTTSNDTSLGYTSYNATEERIKKERRLDKRNEIMGYLKFLNPQDLGDLEMMTSTINEAIAVPDETSSEAKSTTIAMVENLAKVMSSQAKEIVTSADDIEGSASSVLEVIGSLQVPPTTDSIGVSESVNQTSVNNNRTQTVIDSMMANILSNMLIGQDNVRVDSTDITTSCSRSSPDTLREKKVFDQGDGVSMTLPNMTTFFKNSTDKQVDIQVIARKNNPFQYDNSSSLVSGRVVSMDMRNNGSRMNVQNLTERIEVYIIRDTIEPALKENETTEEVKMYGNTSAPGLDLTLLIFPDIERDRSLTVNLISLGQKNMEIGQSYNYTIFLYMRAHVAPKEDYGLYDNLCVLSGQTVTPYEKYYATDDEDYPRPWNDTHDYLSEVTGETKCFYSNSLLNRLANSSLTTFYVGIRHKMGLNKTVNGSSEGAFQQMRFEATYFTSQCLYLDETSGEWRFEGLEVGPESTRTRTQCLSNHLTSFGSGFSVPMNTVDLSQSPFSSLNENPVVFVFMVCCMMLYLTVILWARKVDQRDLVMAGVTPLKDNDPRDKIKYEITVFTGVKKKAGTSATVSFMIAGDEGESGIRVFQDEKRKIFERGNIDTFVLTTKRTLGQLIHIRIWHNNTGKRPSWFLSRISIKDLQTNRVYYFMLEKWLAVEEDDGQIERIIPAAGRSELTSFGHLFHSKTRRNLQDSHLWFSVFFRPSKSNFTRVQRATCCLSLLFSTMMANIIFYGVDMISAGGPVIKVFGPIEFSLTQVVTGVISSLMVFPTSLFTVQLFRTSEPKPEGARFFCRTKRKKAKKSEPTVSSISSSLQTETKMTEEHQNMHDLMLEKDKMAILSSDVSRPQSTISRHSTASNNSVHIEMKPIQTKKIEESKEHLVLGYKVKRKQRKRYLLNWRFKYVGWFIAVANIGVAFWLTISYAAAFGAKKANEWLTSIAIALCQDVLVSQPIKVILIAVFFSLVIKNPIKEDDNSPPPPELEDGEELLHERMTEEELENAQMLEQFERERAETIASSMPPDTDDILEARETRFKEIRMHIIVREIIIYILFLYVLMFVSFGNSDYNSYLLRQSSVETYVNAAYNGKLKFTKAFKREQFWNWTDNVLLPSLFPQNLSNGLSAAESIQLVADQQSYLIGVPKFRQLRIEKDKCEVPDVMKSQFKQDCRVPYSYGDEEVANFYQGWKPIKNASLTPNYDENIEIGAWEYHSWYDLKQLPFWGNVAWYSGGGYIAQLGSTIDESLAQVSYLRETDWLDQYTRAIFIEFAVYNSAMDFYTISYLMADFLPQGGMLGYVDFQVTKLKTVNNLNFIGYVLLSLEAIFLLFVLFFAYTELKKFLKMRRKYFKEKENVVELITLAIAITAVCMYFYRLFESMSLISEREQAPTKLLNFQYVVQWETYFTWMMSFVLFVYSIKFLKLLRFNYRLRLFCETVMVCWYEVLLFLIMFGVIFMAYTCCGYLFFSKSLFDYVTVVTTMESLFSFLLGKFDFESLVGVDKILGPLFFISFALISIFILMNMFLTVIIEAFYVVKHTSSENIQNDLEIVDFMIHRFKIWTGFAEKRLKKPVKPPGKYIPGIDPVQVECDELKGKLTLMVDKLNWFIRKERTELLGADSYQSEERIIFTG